MKTLLQQDSCEARVKIRGLQRDDSLILDSEMLLIRGDAYGLTFWIRLVVIMKLSQARISQAPGTCDLKGRLGHLHNVYLTSSGSQDLYGF